LLQAWPDREIAARLGITVRTTRFHVSNILSKCRIANRVKLILAALSQQQGPPL
jgi:DNA-binding NarL/FixJ family response regulator